MCQRISQPPTTPAVQAAAQAYLREFSAKRPGALVASYGDRAQKHSHLANLAWDAYRCRSHAERGMFLEAMLVHSLNAEFFFVLAFELAGGAK